VITFHCAPDVIEKIREAATPPEPVPTWHAPTVMWHALTGLPMVVDFKLPEQAWEFRQDGTAVALADLIAAGELRQHYSLVEWIEANL
jgi:hypothetical protein